MYRELDMAAEPHYSLSFVYDNLTLFLVFVTTLIITYYFTRRGTNDPPGPPLWPIFGNLFSMVDKDLFRKLSEIRHRYGDVFSLYIGSEQWVFLNGYDAIHDALVKKGRLFSGRPISNFTKQFSVDKLSALVLVNGAAWKDRRAFLVLALRDLCFSDNGNYIEELIQNEVDHFMKDLNPGSKSSVTVDPKSLVTRSLLNVIVTVIHGKRLGNEDHDIKMYVERIERGVKIYAYGQILASIFPFMHESVWKLLGVIDDTGVNKIVSFNKRMAAQAMNDYEEGRERCLVHHYVKVLKSAELGGKPVSLESFDVDALTFLIQDLMFAGSETSATTIKWILLQMVLNTDLQKKLQKEIDDNIPLERLPSLSDRPCLPLVEATILEGLRFGMIVPLSVPRTVTEDTVFNGYHIKKNTSVIPNLSSVLMDSQIFPEPNVFKPERFLDDSRTHVLIPKEMVTFSLGPRSCPGETLARLEIFLYVTAILQRYHMQLPDGVDKPSTRGVLTATYQPQPYTVTFIPRSHKPNI